MRRSVANVPWVRLHALVQFAELSRLFELMAYTPTGPQLIYHKAAGLSRFRVLNCGRRLGKTVCICHECLAYAMLGGRTWMVAPTYDLTSRSFAYALQAIQKSPAMRSLLAGPPRESSGSQSITFQSGGFVEFKSSFNPDSLVGAGLDHVGFDEAALEADGGVWTQKLRPTLIDRIGSASFASTPRGNTWFKDAFARGQVPGGAYQSWRFATSSNPLITRQEIRDLIRDEDMSEADIKQEIFARFLDELGTVFRNYGRCMLIDQLDQRIPEDGAYVMGVDLAKYNDWTVITVMGSLSGRVVYVERFNSTDWPFQVHRICEVARAFGARPLVDSTGVGDPIVDYINHEGVNAEGFVLSNSSKVQVVRQLSRAIQAQEIKLLQKGVMNESPGDVTGELMDVGSIMASEIGSYTYERLPGGGLRLTAPKGKHDDCVISLALCYQAALMFGGTGVSIQGSMTGSSAPKVAGAFSGEEEARDIRAVPDWRGGKKPPQMSKRRRR